jgi:hypothetical protein
MQKVSKKICNTLLTASHNPKGKKNLNPVAKNHSVVYYAENYKQTKLMPDIEKNYLWTERLCRVSPRFVLN